jgi:WD40 repeat protein
MPGLRTAIVPVAPLPALPPGSEDWPCLPGYEILGMVRSGSREISYRARHSALGRVVALQIIRPQWLNQPNAVRRCRRAARAASRLAHAHLAQVLEVGQAGSVHFLATEDGIDLTGLVRAGGSLPWQGALAWVRQAALGLAHAHAHDLVHGDIQPAHLLLTGLGNGDDAPGSVDLEKQCVKLTGFGLAWLSGPGGASGQQAPAHKSACDSRADLSGLGRTLYYLLTGQVPRPDGPEDVLRRLRPDVPPAVAAVVHRLLAGRSAAAFQSAAHAAATLGLFTQDRRPMNPPSVGGGLVGEPAAVAGAQVRCLSGAGDAVTGIACAADGRRLAAASRARSLCFWDLETGALLSCQTPPLERILALTFAADGSLHVAGTRGAGLRCWNADRTTVSGDWPRRAGPVEALSLSADGRQLLAGGADQLLRLWESGVPRPKRCIGGVVVERHWGPIRALAFAADGRRALSGSDDRTVRLWDLTSGHELRCFRDHAAPVECVALTADGRRALSGGGSGVRLWDVTTGALLARLAGHERGVRCLAVAADGRYAASGSDDCTVRLWDLEEGRALACLSGHLGPVLAVQFIADGRHIVSGSTDRSVRIWQIG